MRSDFGRGYAVCLLMFAFHEPRLDEQVALWEMMRIRDPRLFSEADACETWANGASDHLYDLIRPRRGVNAEDWRAAKAVADRAIAVGHDYRHHPHATAAEMHDLCAEARRLIDAAAGREVRTFAEAWTLDESLGLRPVRGDSATCEEPLPTGSGAA